MYIMTVQSTNIKSVIQLQKEIEGFQLEIQTREKQINEFVSSRTHVTYSIDGQELKLWVRGVEVLVTYDIQDGEAVIDDSYVGFDTTSDEWFTLTEEDEVYIINEIESFNAELIAEMIEQIRIDEGHDFWQERVPFS